MTAALRHLRHGRARIRGAATMLAQAAKLLRYSTGLESMSVSTADALSQDARALDGFISDLRWLADRLDGREAEANAHQAEMRRKRRAAA